MEEIRREPLVRIYSLQLSDTDILSKGPAAVAEAKQEDDRTRELALQEWQKWICLEETLSDPRFKTLTLRTKLLTDSWGTFGSLFDVDIIKYGLGHSFPTMDTFLRAVDDANAGWESNKQTRMGRAKEHFILFMNTLNDYSFLFSIIPNNDKYTCLITGVLSSIAKAAAKYQEISEKIAQALERITYDIRQVRKRTKIADTDEIRHLAIEFFIGVFELLCLIMSWYSSRSKRFIGSFTKSLNQDLDDKVDAIQQILKKLSEETTLITQFRVHDLHEDVAGISSKLVNANSRLQNVEAMLQDFVTRIGLLDAGHATPQQLNSIYQHSIEKGVVVSTCLTDYHATGYASSVNDKTDENLTTLPLGCQQSGGA